MRWVKRGLVAIAALVVVVVAIGGWYFWRASTEPEFLEGAPSVTPAEARELVAKLTAAPAAVVQPAPGAPPTPYRLSLDERQIAAIVVANAPPALTGSVRDLRVRIRASDLVAAGTMRASPMEGQTAWIDVRPSVGSGGSLCLGFGRLHLGEAEVPDSLVRELSGGRGIPARRCAPARGLLPGPLTSLQIAGGRVELRGYTRRP